MKKTLTVLLFSSFIAGAAYAGTQTQQPPLMAMSLPQPCTMFICTAGVVFFRYLTKRIP